MRAPLSSLWPCFYPFEWVLSFSVFDNRGAVVAHLDIISIKHFEAFFAEPP